MLSESSGELAPLSQKSPAEVWFISGDIYAQVTGGTLCDRMVLEELQRGRKVHVLIPQIRSLSYERQLLAGLLNNLRNFFRAFPRGSLLFIDHGVYRDCFLAANLWKWIYRCRVVALVYHLDYNQPEMRGGRTLRTFVEKLMIRSYDYILTISRSTAEHLRLLGVWEIRIGQIPVSRRIAPREGLVREARESVVLLFVGAIQPRKGLLDAIQALAMYSGKKRITFLCVGPCDSADPYAQELSAAASGVPGLNFELAGAVSHEVLIETFAKADGFLFPSRWEGYGIAIEEAMCFALPVIAYSAGSIPELVSDGITGWLVPPGDIAALARAITACVDDPEERQRRGLNGLERARELTATKDLGHLLDGAIAAAANRQ